MRANSVRIHAQKLFTDFNKDLLYMRTNSGRMRVGKRPTNFGKDLCRILTSFECPQIHSGFRLKIVDNVHLDFTSNFD